MDILRFDLLIITTLLLAFGLILIATQADGAIDIEVRSVIDHQLYAKRYAKALAPRRPLGIINRD